MMWDHCGKRSFPWRLTNDPFAVLLAEFMLQRTQAPQAARVFQAFLAAYPNPAAVVSADAGVVVSSLEALGLRHRAVRLQGLCRAIVERHAGRVPEHLPDLLALPGVGPYIAAAVHCFGWGHDVAVVDRTTARVLVRVFGLEPASARVHTDRGVWEFARSLVPQGRGKEYNFTLIDFAAAVCSVRPKHSVCPLTDACCYYLSDHTPKASQAV